MLRKIKKGLAIGSIIVLFPYILTIFMNGRDVKETDLLKQHCIGVLAKEVSVDYEDEMLKTQAILVRTTVYQQVQEQGKKFTEQKDFGKIDDIDRTW